MLVEAFLTHLILAIKLTHVFLTLMLGLRTVVPVVHFARPANENEITIWTLDLLLCAGMDSFMIFRYTVTYTPLAAERMSVPTSTGAHLLIEVRLSGRLERASEEESILSLITAHSRYLSSPLSFVILSSSLT